MSVAARPGHFADLLALQGADAKWPTGRWTGSTWTLLLLVACGLPAGHPSARVPVERLIGRFMPVGEEQAREIEKMAKTVGSG